MFRLIIVFALLLSKPVLAEEGHHSIGLQAGQVGLTSDVGMNYGNALGWGLFFDYAASDWLEFELDYLNSKHTANSLSLKQSTFGAAVLYNIDQLDILIPYLKAGTEFVSHTLDIGASTYDVTAFGLDLGFGGKMLINKYLMSGVDFTYHGIFDASVTPPGGSAVKAAQSYFTVMVRLGFMFGGAK